MTLNRFSHQRGVDPRYRSSRIDFTKAHEDPGFRDIIELYGERFAWTACIEACEKELTNPNLTVRQRVTYEIAKDNATAQLRRLPK